MATVSVKRRSGDTFAPINAGGQVKPHEAVRYSASGIHNFMIHMPEFKVTDNVGNTVFDYIASFNVLSGEDAWVDTTAPDQEGLYTLTLYYQAYPFLPFMNTVHTTFAVSVHAPAPPSGPPSVLGSMKNLLILGGVVVVAAAILPSFLRKRS